MNEITQRIQQFTAELSSAEQKLAVFLQQPQNLPDNLTIGSLAQASQVSPATVSRFAKSLGYANFAALRVALTSEAQQQKPLFQEVEATDDALTVAHKVFAANQHSLSSTLALLRQADLEQAVNLLTAARQVGFFGLGGSNIVAADAYHKFMRTPLTVSFNADFHLQLMQAARLQATDCAVVISHTGRDEQVLQLVKQLQANQVPIVVVTSFGKAPLAQYSAVTFVSLADESKYRSEALSSMLAQSSIIDTLFLLVSLALPKATQATFEQIRQVIGSTRRDK
ncbi:MurR/RpiR family transcriptional regulator [Loigolactobacillus jiayinensis]|uniref:MurR/RpiR family transcriptional regulator n=1 Tax=Loigolactobacillus jiayinensis TaxID=2486016 RepID=A0ABW1RIR1_9LACO|nr:MurR/RpiR family transcriptional regulator [Loigolactobacillus jiayinensis]